MHTPTTVKMAGDQNRANTISCKANRHSFHGFLDYHTDYRVLCMFYSTLCLKVGAYFQNVFELNTSFFGSQYRIWRPIPAIEIAQMRPLAKQIGISLMHISMPWMGLEFSGFSMWHFLKLVIRGFLQVLLFPPLLHRLMVQPIK